MSTQAPAPATAPAQALRLDAQLCFAVHAASRAFDGVYRVILRDAGLTYPQYLVMLVLWEHGELSVKDLGRRLRLDSGTLSPLLKRLESAGRLERRRDPEDERSVLVHPTPAGMLLRDQVAAAVPAGIGSATGLSLTEMHELRRQLLDLTGSLDAALTRLSAGADEAVEAVREA